jgi:hypothetical protein
VFLRLAVPRHETTDPRTAALRAPRCGGRLLREARLRRAAGDADVDALLRGLQVFLDTHDAGDHAAASHSRALW